MLLRNILSVFARLRHVSRRVRRAPEVPVIFLTARSDEIDRIVGLEIGADDYVTKPFSPRELVARIRVILRRAGATIAPRANGMTIAAAAVSPLPRFELRALEARVLFHGRPLELTRYEYLLLKTLPEHPGHVLSRAQLMQRVWSGAPDTLERTVDAHVKSLRARLRLIDGLSDPSRRTGASATAWLVHEDRPAHPARLFPDGRPGCVVLALCLRGAGQGRPLGKLPLLSPQTVAFHFDLGLDGIERQHVVPVAKNSQIRIKSNWRHPQFGGRFLPPPKNRVIDEQGFNVAWDISSLATNAQTQLSAIEGAFKVPDSAPLAKVDRFSVGFIEPVNVYSQADRATKYGVLFVALTFAAFFLFEILKSLPIHPVQYLLVGLSLVIFFLLLVGLAEHIAFLAASAACIVLTS